MYNTIRKAFSGISLLVCSLIAAFGIIAACSSQYDRKAIRQSVEYQTDRYPECTLRDLYKNFFQDAFGPGHLMPEEENAVQTMRAYIVQECAEAAAEKNLCPEYEQTGWHGRFYRVNLSVINDGKVPLDTLLNALVMSIDGTTLPDVAEWRSEWNAIVKEIERQKLELPQYERDKYSIDSMLLQGKYVSHHSVRYNDAYHPHYRLIEKSVFESRLLPLIEARK